MNKDIIEKIFQKTKVRYQGLQNTNVKLVFANGWFFTMRTSVSLLSFFRDNRTYIVLVNMKRNNIISQLSESDITGWLAHELAHIIEYETMSNIELLLFTLKYIFNPKFRFAVEKRINAFACNNSFAKELFCVWEKFLSLDNVSKKYKKYICKNYCPNYEDIKQIAQSYGITEAFFESNIKNNLKKNRQ